MDHTKLNHKSQMRWARREMKYGPFTLHIKNVFIQQQQNIRILHVFLYILCFVRQNRALKLIDLNFIVLQTHKYNTTHV